MPTGRGTGPAGTGAERTDTGAGAAGAADAEAGLAGTAAGAEAGLAGTGAGAAGAGRAPVPGQVSAPGRARETGGFPYRLVATDLDGTLLRSDDTVSPRTRAALLAAAEAGAPHIVVTGRAVPWTKKVLEELDYQGLAVCAQGAQVYDAGSGRLLTSVTLERGLARRAIELIEDVTGPLALAVSRDGLDGDVLTGPGYETLSDALASIRLDDADRAAALWEQPINKVYIQHAALDSTALAAVAQSIAGQLVGVVMAGEGVVELLPLGLTKATGLSIAARRLGVKPAETIAFGDMPNDIPMFHWAAYGVAMAEAHESLKALADETTLSHDADGIATVLERLLSH
ncbi:HAD family hydrolase [Streptomyces sp. SPB074]|uniref:HAD family hydrolase n=1 Tax=Streptomyces sp. (strain SPB074) TaxID=465543 RepID=UPI00017FEC29|nr:cof protein [Streptomyces sp. SPB074]